MRRPGRSFGSRIRNRIGELWRWLSPGGRRVTERTAEEMDRRAETRRRANRLFDRRGPSRRDLLPGGRYETKTGRPPSAWLRRRP